MRRLPEGDSGAEELGEAQAATIGKTRRSLRTAKI